MVDAVKLFNDFKMKKELETDSKKVLEIISKKIDSVENEIKLIGLNDGEKKRMLIQHYNFYRNKYDEEYKQSNQTINEEVWKRLNPLLDEYGKKNNFNLIIGANGMGSVLYNDDYYNITESVINYVNNKYDKGL